MSEKLEKETQEILAMLRLHGFTLTLKALEQACELEADMWFVQCNIKDVAVVWQARAALIETIRNSTIQRAGIK